MIVQIYSDGSGNSFGNAGGWAFVVVVDGVKTHEDSGGEKNATNNTMELLSALKGLEYVSSKPEYAGADITLISDSQLVLGFASGRWNCKKLHLMLLASKLQTLFKKLNAKERWERGHQGEPNNERCDALAKAARETLIP
jgi:ribonuclease HI